jgi:GNAT superfamily N-acetyltransferase
MTPPPTIREARASDAEAIARAHLKSSDEAYAPLAKEWRGPDLEANTARWHKWLEADPDPLRIDLLLEIGGNVVAFAGGGSARRSDVGADVEVRVIHVLPEFRGKGLGSQLWSATTKRLRGEDLRSMYVATLAELRCCSFYEAHGGAVASRHSRDFHGNAATDVIYLWPLGHSSEPRR